MDISIIAAIDPRNNGLGRDGKLLCKNKEDMQRFKSLTQNSVVIMGSRTWLLDLCKKPLPNRVNVVLTSKHRKENSNSIFFYGDPDAVLAFCFQYDKPIFVIGGASVYQQFLDKVTKLYITELESTVEPDVFFPFIDPSIWYVESSEQKQNLVFKTYALKI